MNLFGTDGIRAKVGSFPLNEKNLIDLANAISLWMKEKYNDPKLLLAHDTRLSCSLIKSYLNAGFIQNNINIYDTQILPTPAIYNFVNTQKLFDFGIVITASHNKYQDNGIKIIQKNGKLSDKDEQKISEIFQKKHSPKIDFENLGIVHYWKDAIELYISSINKFFRPNFLKNIKVAVDCANGTTSQIAPKIFQSFGAELFIIGNSPNGKNINEKCGSTNPNNLKKLVIKEKADIGFAFDGDGDRIIVVNRNGDIKDGDDILALLLHHPAYKTNSIISTIVSNYGLELYLNKQNKKLIRTNVGEKFVLRSLEENKLILGGEQSGHIILRDYINSSDCIFTALRILETIKLTDNWLINTFEKSPQYLINLPVKSKKNLNDEPFSTILSDYSNSFSGRLVIRYSETEALLRVMVESESLEISKDIASKVSQDLNVVFKSI